MCDILGKSVQFCTLFFLYNFIKEQETGMAYIYYNPNPSKKLVGDCVIRGLSKLTGRSWKDIHIDLCLQSFAMDDIPSSNSVWGSYLYKKGYRQHVIPDTCPNCYSVRKFCLDYPEGSYLLATGSHVIAVESGNYFDTWDSGDEVPIYYWRKEV